MGEKFRSVSVKDTINELKKDKEFKKEYEQSRALFEVQKAILKARTEQGLSQKRLAEMIGVSPGDLSKIERGKENTTVKTLYKVAEALDKKLEIHFV